MRSWLVIPLALFVSSATLAQDSVTGSIVHNNARATFTDGQNQTGDDARNNLDQMAACLFSKHEGEIKRALALPDDTKGQNDALAPATFNECIANLEIRFPMSALRDGFYKALIRKEFMGRAVKFPVDLVDFSVTDAALPRSTSATVHHGKLLNFAECVVKAAPEDARALVLSAAGSKRETAAIATLTPTFGPCMSPGVSIKFNKGMLVGLIAEAYYRWANAPQSLGSK